MIVRRYGKWYHSVQPNFNPTAMTEIGFQRDRVFSIAAAELEDGYRELEAGELGADANAEVQRDAERTLLADLESSLRDWAARLESGQLLVVKNGRGDWPKTRERREAVIVDGENRFHFHWWVDPPLRVGIYGKGGSE